jgi:uncharacterized membrane protein
MGPLLTFAGSLLLLFYLSDVGRIPFQVLGLGVFMIASGTIFLYNMIENDPKSERFFFVSVYILYLTLLIMPFIRFPTLSGVDNLREYKAAEITLNQGWNTAASIETTYNLGPQISSYSSSLSVTILPTIISIVSGLNLIYIYKFGLNFVIALVPILVYLNAREIFQRRGLAALSAIMYSELYFIFSSMHMEPKIATIFLLSTFLILFKLLKRPKKAFVTLLSISIFGTITGHYTVAYFSDALFLTILLALFGIVKSSKIKRFLRAYFEKPYASLHYLTYIFVFSLTLSLAWLSFVPTSPFSMHLQQLINRKPVFSPLPQYSVVEASYLLESPLGPLVDNWFRFEFLLPIFGFLFLTFSRRKKNLRMFLWLSCGGFFLASFLVGFIPFFYLIFGDFIRVYYLGFPFLCVFGGFTLFTLNKKSKYNVVVVIFLLLNLPMNMLLPVHYRYVLYHPENTVSQTIAITQTYITTGEHEIAKWISRFILSSEILATDLRGFYILYPVDNPIEVCPYNISLNFVYDSKYLVLHHFALQYGLYVVFPETLRQLNLLPLIHSNNVIYNDGAGILLMRR